MMTAGLRATVVALRWLTQDPGCIDEATLTRTVETTLGRPIFHPEAAASARIEGAIGRSAAGKGFRATITLRSPSGDVVAERELSSSAASCDRMDESVAIVVALMADDLHEAPEPPAVAPPVLAPPVLAPPVAPLALLVDPPAASWGSAERAQPSPASPKPRASTIVEAEVGGAFASGLLPRPGPGAYLRAALGRGRSAVAIDAYGFLPSRTLDAGAGAEINAWAFDLSACHAPIEASSLRIGGCLLLGGGWTDARSVGGTEDGLRRALPFAFGGASLDAAVHLEGPLWLHLRPAVWSPFASAQYFFHGRDGSEHTVFKQWPVSPSVSVGIGARSDS